jgi:hypothetical protein
MNRVFITLASVLLLAFAAPAQTTNSLSEAEVQGQQLAQQLCEAQPAQNSTNIGVLQIRDTKGNRTEIPLACEVIVTATNWQSIYSLHRINTNENHAAWMALAVTHFGSMPNTYQFYKVFLEADKYGPVATNLLGDQIMVPFADSDFWIVDLGLEFFHWPKQKVLKYETRRTRACTVLESTTDPAPGSYSHVDSWIDDETLGIVHAEAYDASGKLLKVFDPKSFKKVNGQWELQDMEIRNVQTGSRTWIKFNLSDKS